MPESRLNAYLRLVGTWAYSSKAEFNILNNINWIGQLEQQHKTKNQNLPKMEKQNTQGALPGLPLVGYARISLV